MSLKRLATISAALVLGLATFGFSKSADAGVYFSSGYSGGYGGGYGYSSGYGYSGGYGLGYGGGYRAPVWHDTSHYHYHPTSVYRHGNHYHVNPGHYDLHRSGHWHY